MDKATPTPSPASVDSFKFNKAVDPMPGHELCGDYARALLAAQPSGTNLAQECAKARRHGFLDALSSGTARELCALLRRGVNQLEAWHAKYGEHQPQWLPPAGDVRWMEDVAAALDGRAALRAEVERLAAQSAPTEEMSPEFTDTARAALLWVLWHHQGASSKVGQPIRFALGMDQYQPLSEYQVREAKRWAALNPTRDAANVPPGEWQNEGEGLTPKQAWWAGYRVGKGLPPDMPRSEAVAQSAPLAQQAAREYPPLPEPIPPNVFWARLADNFYSADGRGMGEEFYSKWEPRSAEFPQGEAWGWGKPAHNPFKDADRAAAQVEPVRMLLASDVEAIKRALDELNRVRVIPADGEVRNG